MGLFHEEEVLGLDGELGALHLHHEDLDPGWILLDLGVLLEDLDAALDLGLQDDLLLLGLLLQLGQLSLELGQLGGDPHLLVDLVLDLGGQLRDVVVGVALAVVAVGGQRLLVLVLEQELDQRLVEQRQVVALVVGEDLVVLLDRRVELQRTAEGDRHADVGLGVAGELGEHLLEALGRGLVVGGVHGQQAEVHVGFEVVLVELERLLEGHDRFALLVLLEEREADVVVDVRVLGIELQGVGRRHLAHPVHAGQEVDARQGLVGAHILGVLEQQALDRLDALVVLARLRQRAGVVVDHVGVAGVLGEVLLVDRQRVGGLVVGQQGDGQVLDRRLEAGVDLEGPTVELRGRTRAAQLVGHDAAVEAGLDVGAVHVLAEADLAGFGVLVEDLLPGDGAPLCFGLRLEIEAFLVDRPGIGGRVRVLRVSSGRAGGVAAEREDEDDRGGDESRPGDEVAHRGHVPALLPTRRSRRSCTGWRCSRARGASRRWADTPPAAAG